MDNGNMDVTASDISQTPVQETSQVPIERSFKQSELNEIAGRIRSEAVESYKRQQAQIVQQSQSAPISQQHSLSEEDVKRVTGEELHRQREEWERENLRRQHAEAADRIVRAYNEKIGSGKNRYQDFDKVVSNVEMSDFTNVVQILADHIDNAADVLYDLAQRPSKMHDIDDLWNKDPKYAIYEMRRLSDSIKANEQSSKVKTSNLPLSQQRPSNTGMDSGALSMSDLRRKYKG